MIQIPIFKTVPLEDGPLDDELWHCIDVCHSAAKRHSIYIYILGQ